MSKNLPKEIDTLRSQIAQLKNELHQLRHAPIHPADVQERCASVVQAMAGMVDAEALGAWLAGANAPSPNSDVLRDAVMSSDRPGCVVAWYDQSGLTKRFVALARPHATGTVPLSERPSLQADLEARLFSLEVAEEKAICEAEAAGVEIFRRPDIDPAIVLEASQ